MISSNDNNSNDSNDNNNNNNKITNFSKIIAFLIRQQ